MWLLAPHVLLAGFVLRAPAPAALASSWRLSGVVALAAPQIELQSLPPMTIPIDPQAEVTLALQVPGGAPTSVAWLAGRSLLAVLDGGRILAYDSVEGVCTELLPSRGGPVPLALAPFGAKYLAVCGPTGLLGVDVDEALPVDLGLAGAVGLSARAAAAVSADAVLAAVGEGSEGELLVLRAEEAPVPLLVGCGSVSSVCVGHDESSVLLSVGSTVYRATLNVELTAAAQPVEVASTAPHEAACVATDSLDNVYVCSSAGVQVLDERGEAVQLLSTPEPATSCCFGGAGMSTLFVTAGESVWAVQTNMQGAAPPSEEFMRRMDKLVAAGDFRHVGW